MASKPRKLKVFQARLGFYETVVAAPSQAAALRAWGTHQNLFADGVATAASDDAAIEAALARPETVLRRAIGTAEPFGLNPGLPQLPDEPATGKRMPPKAAAARKSAAARPAPVRKPPPDRRPLDAAEARLEQVRREHAREEAEFQARREALDCAEQDARERWEREAAQAEAARRSALERYRKAGGR